MAAIGLATGGGMYFAAIATTIIAIIILWALQPLEKRYARKFKKKSLKIVTGLDVDQSRLLKSLFGETNLDIDNFSLQRNDREFIFQLNMGDIDKEDIVNLITELKKDETIKDIFWSK